MAEHGLKDRLSATIRRLQRAEKLVTLTLLFLLLTIAAASVTSVLIGPDWGSLWEGLLFGLLAGWLLAIFRQPTFRSVILLLVLGAAYALLSTGSLSQKVTPVLFEPLRLLVVIVTSPRGTEIDLTPLIRSVQDLFVSLAIVLERVRAWVVDLMTGEPTFDPVAAGIVWSMLVWLVAAWAGWVVEARRNGLLAVIPAILLSVSTLSYGRRTSSTIYFILGLALVLIATVQHDQRESEWDESGVAYPTKKGRQIGNVAVFITAAVVLFSAGAASISLKSLENWLTVSEKRAPAREGGLAKSLGILPASTAAPDEFQSVRRPGLPRDLLIGSGPELSRELVMTVEVGDLDSVLPASRPWPLYWRSFTYDIYTGSGWRSGDTQETSYQPDQLLGLEALANHVQIQATVRPAGKSDGAIYAAGEPLKVDAPSAAAWRSNNDLFGIQMEAGIPYEVRSLIPEVKADTLRSAGQRYPDWVRQRYLALPAEVPGRVKELAIQLTSTEPTPYDRVRSIERYLRTFPYTVDVSRPPSSQDLVDFFLFDLKKGYCDYYASAMVVLARAAGIPARLVIGYASGEYNLNSRRFVVTQADAHSWVEVYFPNTGWIPFEPTASLPSLEELSGATTETPDVTIPTIKPPAPSAIRLIPWKDLIFPGSIAIAFLLVVAWAAYDWLSLDRLPERLAAAEVYRRMRRYGGRLFVVLAAGDTPYEYATALSLRLQELARRGLNPGLVAATSGQIQAITDRIVRVSYRPVQSEDSSGVQIQRQWHVLRWRLQFVMLIRTWMAIFEHFLTIEHEIPKNNVGASPESGSSKAGKEE